MPWCPSKPIATRTFCISVSLTVEDLKEEGDALQREVFPKLFKLCEQHCARFQAIDLPWSVRDEAALDQQRVEICLREIRRCQVTGVKPNFIVLLGDCGARKSVQGPLAATTHLSGQPPARVACPFVIRHIEGCRGGSWLARPFRC